MRAPFFRVLRWLPIVLAVAGCVHLARPILQSPLTYSEQEKEVLSKVPIGTPRTDALKRLEQVGIEGSFGSSRRIYYCDLWNRPNGERWHMDVALLFDESDKLYKTQNGETQVSAMGSERSLAEKQQAEAEVLGPAAAAKTK